MTRAYLDIERARFEQRLRVKIEVPAGLSAVRVPPLVLQPIVENAVKHGISRKLGGGTVSIDAAIDGALLTLTVGDDGSGCRSASSTRSTSRRRAAQPARALERLYGPGPSAADRERSRPRHVVRLRLPVQRPRAAESRVRRAGELRDRTLVVDGELARDRLSGFLSRLGGVEVIGEASNGVGVADDPGAAAGSVFLDADAGHERLRGAARARRAPAARRFATAFDSTPFNAFEVQIIIS